MKKVKRISNNAKLEKFGKLADQMLKLGFEGLVVIGIEKNEQLPGFTPARTYLSIKNTDKSIADKYESDVTKLLSFTGFTPKEISETVTALKAIQEIGELSVLVDKLNMEIDNLDDEKIDRVRNNIENANNDTKVETTDKDVFFELTEKIEEINIISNDLIQQMEGQISMLPSVRKKTRNKRKEENKAEYALNPAQKVELYKIRERKNKLVAKGNYEKAAATRAEELQLLGINY